jgi:hypothetical protein
LIFASERRIAGQEQEEEDPQGPIVAFLVVELLDDFGGKVAGLSRLTGTVPTQLRLVGASDSNSYALPKSTTLRIWVCSS